MARNLVARILAMTLVSLKLGAYRQDIPRDTSDGFSVRLG